MLMKGIFDHYVLWRPSDSEHPSPLRHADVLNGWSPIQIHTFFIAAQHSQFGLEMKQTANL